MNSTTLALLAKKAALTGQMVAHYPAPDNEKVTFPPSPYYRFLKLLAQEMDSNLSVELGVCGGGGSLHLAMTSRVAAGVDVADDYPDNRQWIQNCYPNWHFLQGDSIEFAPIIHDRFGKIDILFIDTTHTKMQTIAEYNAYEPYLSERAIVCLDDLFRPGMVEALDSLPGNKLRFDFLHPSASPTDGGFAVVWNG